MKVIILTTRNPEKIYDWLEKNDLLTLVDRVTREKPPALVYLDDRAVAFRGSFSDAFTDITQFVPYWRKS